MFLPRYYFLVVSFLTALAYSGNVEADFGHEVSSGKNSTLRIILDLGMKPTKSNLRVASKAGEEIIETEIAHRSLRKQKETQPPTRPPTRLPQPQPPTRPPTQITQTRPPTRFPTRPPTQGAQPQPTRLPTRPLTQTPTQPPFQATQPQPTRLPTRPLTLPPTRAPTRLPTTQAIAAAPPGPANNIQQQWLDEHNTRRQAFYDRFPEYNLSPAPLKWSDSVARSAQNYANKLIAEDGCKIQHGLNDDNYGGENLAANWGSGSYASARSPTDVLEAWYDDEIDLDRMQLVGQKFHATQVIWRSSGYLGCAQAEKTLGSSTKCFIQVCRYIKPGNCFFTGQAKYYPDNCLQKYRSESNWICNVLSDDISSVCVGADEQCPAEGCF
mmetsp:Transcript_11822/g.18211  ORF Transcript_11822/g.18211 Transcript_11822/m.18211 type:complete len:383 (-) Transcript_11822:105-1253(-)